ncbi:MAG: NAD-dependent epimerase/dehydratase family protein [Candidatus Omnitrophota bacterium]|nr:NAD-dependent epimerase/dehydratase family protein [Candidatus Omnitrophota bacterium]
MAGSFSGSGCGGSFGGTGSYILKKIANETGLEVVILRLPLVYGVGVKANFKNLIKLAGSGLPLPFKGINNRRSFLYIGNLVDAIGVCVEHPKAAGLFW